MKVILRTRCGCTRKIEVEDGTRSIAIPIIGDLRGISCSDDDSIPGLELVRQRKFNDTGYYERDIPVFLEVL